MHKNIIIGVIILVLGLGAVWYWNQVNNTVPTPSMEIQNEARVYENTTYGYSFTYPPTWDVNEYTPEAVAIGTAIEDGFDARAEVDVITSTDGTSYQSYDDFLFERASVLCAADGPNETINCTKIERKEAFTTTSGLSGEKIYLELARTNFETNTTATSSYGPLFAFNVGANVPEANFAAIVVYPPLASYLMNTHTDTADRVAEEIQIDRVERTQ